MGKNINQSYHSLTFNIMNLTCAIVDDEPLALDLLESYVNKNSVPDIEGKVFQCRTGYEGTAE